MRTTETVTMFEVTGGATRWIEVSFVPIQGARYDWQPAAAPSAIRWEGWALTGLFTLLLIVRVARRKSGPAEPVPNVLTIRSAR